MKTSLLVLLAAATAALTALSCFSDRTTVTGAGGEDCRVPASAIGPNRVVVLIRSFAFHPDTVRVRPGTTVTWVNCEPENIEAHTSTANAPDDWDSGFLAPGESFAHEFSAPGTSGYFCIPHPFMIGAIIVQ